eukprot:CAMPEP_0194258548 /NCGR_PEP_ID=MMETSP0158-20130606/41556_1 /TAXON_ID=33649 /ORGANISM="Thalassionema nitzschioides, Strain L26-B" /LENGTH=322 /DNA_ID=CAMNT_0038998009 /DNA_START=28 /DNA_END=996 /DNA_ORIENTATION=+
MPKSFFQYVLIPADSSLAVESKTGDRSGGLANDELVKSAKDYFFELSGGAAKASAWQQATPEQRHAIAQQWRKHQNDQNINMTDDQILNYIQASQTNPSCEIMALTVPTKGNDYQAVSMYTSDHSSENEIKNERACQLLLDCGHRLPETASRKEAGVYGDVFVGRCYDNEQDEDEGWKRLDFTHEDLNSNSDWIKIAKSINGGGGSGASNAASLSGTMNQMNMNPSTQDDESLGYKWDQAGEEVEMRFIVAVDVKAKDVQIKFQHSSLSVKVSGETLAEGATGGAVVVDECTYTLQDDGDNKRELCVILIKKDGRVWAHAVK